MHDADFFRVQTPTKTVQWYLHIPPFNLHIYAVHTVSDMFKVHVTLH